MQWTGAEQPALQLAEGTPPEPHVGGRLESHLVAPRAHRVGDAIGERAPQDRLGGAAVELLVVGQRERQLDEPVVEERQARLDGEGHAVAILVAQQRGQQALPEIERLLRRDRAPESARRTRRPVAGERRQLVRQHAILALPVGAPERREQLSWNPGLDRERQRMRGAEAARHVAPLIEEATELPADEQVAQPQRQVALVAGERLVTALAVEQDAQLEALRQL